MRVGPVVALHVDRLRRVGLSTTDFSAVCGGSTVRSGSGFGPAGMRPK